MGAEQKLGNMGVVTTSLETVVNWGRAGAIWPLLFGLACCAMEMIATQAGTYDASRFGMELMRASPRQADLMIVPAKIPARSACVAALAPAAAGGLPFPHRQQFLAGL